MVIIEITRGHIDLDVNGRRVRVHGEGFHHGPLDFLVIKSSITRWDDGGEVTESERESILYDLQSSAAERGLAIEIE